MEITSLISCYIGWVSYKPLQNSSSIQFNSFEATSVENSMQLLVHYFQVKCLFNLFFSVLIFFWKMQPDGPDNVQKRILASTSSIVNVLSFFKSLLLLHKKVEPRLRNPHRGRSSETQRRILLPMAADPGGRS